MDIDDRRTRFRALHEDGTFLIPNPHDVGTCRLLSTLGFSALATTSGNRFHPAMNSRYFGLSGLWSGIDAPGASL